ncbi:hypothetical protein BDR04DRAFT_1104528 [Suillus decipiens]|nr:hypothetical protein BDR04DRAFT_1104528 [Suillus decipiens]
MTTAIYRLKSIARPLRFVSLVDDDVVGHSDGPGVVMEWFAKFREVGLATFQAVRGGQITNDYIAFDSRTRSLVRSDSPSLFLVKKSPRAPDFNFIGIQGTDLVWALTSWDENTPIQLQIKNENSTEQLWIFEETTE